MAAEASKKWNEALADLEKTRKKVAGKQYNILPGFILFAVVLALIFGLGAYFMGHNYLKFIIVFIDHGIIRGFTKDLRGWFKLFFYLI